MDIDAVLEALQERVDSLKATVPEGHDGKRVELDNFAVLERRHLKQVQEGFRGVEWDKVIPLPQERLKRYEDLPVPSSHEEVRDILSKLVVLKLNGGLGTSMGCSFPKNAIEIREGVNFFDCFVDHIKDLNDTYHVDIPLVLMNSPATDQMTQDLIQKYQGVVRVLCINQQLFPRIDAQTMMPVAATADPAAIHGDEWYPPGHGDVYDTLLQSEAYRTLVDEGKSFLFVSNGDNLGATVDVRILNMMAQDPDLEFFCEVVAKTMRDVKGGTIIEYEDRLKLLEIAQVPADKVSEFTSIDKFSVFNTNSLWFRLDKLRPNLDLDIIVNRKNLKGKPIIQLETAMGAAISQFSNTVSLRVPRERFAPVKTCTDLLLIMSDFYELDKGVLIPCPEVPGTLPSVSLSAEFTTVGDFLARFPKGVPSLRAIVDLKVSGDVVFQENVSLRGRVEIAVPEGFKAEIPAGTTLENEHLTVDKDGKHQVTPLQ